MAQIIAGQDFLSVICKTLGLEKVRRIVIDAAMDDAVILYVEILGDERMIEIANKISGFDIRVIKVQEQDES